VFTHDSIGLGEDGPTHQSVEHVSSLRLIPNLDNWRPCDTTETAVAWAESIKRNDGPSTLIFSRQNLPFQERTDAQVADIARGGYVLREAPNAKVVLIATGSEIELATKAADALAPKASPCAWCRCPRPTCSTARTRPTRQRCCRAACRAWPSKPA
jgi:transketolase